MPSYDFVSLQEVINLKMNVNGYGKFFVQRKISFGSPAGNCLVAAVLRGFTVGLWLEFTYM